MNDSDLATLRASGLLVCRSFFEPETTERFRELGLRIGRDVREGKLQRNGQFVSGMDIAGEAKVEDSAALKRFAERFLGDAPHELLVRLLMKDEAFGGSVMPHQDWPYFGGDTRKLSVFIPLSHCGFDNGSLTFFERSHTLGPVERGEIDVARYPEFPRNCPDLEVGDVLFADFLTWHSSHACENHDDRILIQVVLQSASDACCAKVFGNGYRDGPVSLYRFSPMLRAVPSVGRDLIRLFMSNGQPEEACKMALGILEDDPDNVMAHLALAEIASGRGEIPTPHIEGAERALSILSAKVASARTAIAPESPQAAGISSKMRDALAGMFNLGARRNR